MGTVQAPKGILAWEDSDTGLQAMTMTRGLRKLALTTHVTSSVGWLGAAGAFLALAIAGLVSQDAQIVRAAYLAMDLTTWIVIVQLYLAALLTGSVQSLAPRGACSSAIGSC